MRDVQTAFPGGRDIFEQALAPFQAAKKGNCKKLPKLSLFHAKTCTVKQVVNNKGGHMLL